jgi:hypothetical protein
MFIKKIKPINIIPTQKYNNSNEAINEKRRKLKKEMEALGFKSLKKYKKYLKNKQQSIIKI